MRQDLVDAATEHEVAVEKRYVSGHFSGRSGALPPAAAV
jgi:hypothetical protein